MNKRNYEDFINKYNDELIPRIKETLLSIKPGYEYVIRVESTKTKEFWVSSTNNPEQRMQTLKYLSLDETKWNSVWQEAFAGTNSDEFNFDLQEDITTNLMTKLVFSNESAEHSRLLRNIARNYIKYLDLPPSRKTNAVIKDYIESTNNQVISINRFLSKIDNIIEQ